MLVGILTAGLTVISAWAIYMVAPKGAQTIAELDLPDGRAFLVRHYRSGWFEYPKARFYSRDKAGAWTSFELISELNHPYSTSLDLDETEQEVHVTGVGSYGIQTDEFVNPDGSRGARYPLPPGIEPGEEDLR